MLYTADPFGLLDTPERYVHAASEESQSDVRQGVVAIPREAQPP